MFDLAAKVANYMVLYATAALDCTIHPGDDSQMQALKQNLRMNYVGLYKSLLFATAQIAISLYSDWQFVKALLKHYDWEGQIGEMVEIDGWCKDFERKIEKYKPLNDVSNKEEDQKKAMGPGPRNSLHWAVAFALPNDVSRLVASQEYPINALTPQKWTAAHLAARDGHSNILTALLIAPGIDLRIKNKEGSTPLHIAATYGKMTATRHLLHREIRLLNMRDDRGKTAFLIATMKGHVRVLKVLKENGQDFNQTTNKNGWTGLHMAAENGHLETAKFLLESGTKKDTKTKDKGLTAKQIAEEKKLLELVAIL